jgi:putative hydrolase of the HAD superfamily
MRTERLRAVFFDAGNTLLRMNYPAMAAALAAHEAPVEVAALERAEWRARVRLDERLRAPGRSTEAPEVGDLYLGLILEELGLARPPLVEALGAWRRAYRPPVGVWDTPDPRAAPALHRARQAGLRTAVISNSNGSVRGLLEALGLAAHLDVVLDSFEVGVEKPDPRIFQLALDRLGLAPTEAVHIGDLYAVDVLGARAAGLDAVLLDPGGYWRVGDCPRAPDVLSAVELLVG